MQNEESVTFNDRYNTNHNVDILDKIIDTAGGRNPQLDLGKGTNCRHDNTLR